MPADHALPLDRLVIRNALASGVWRELRMADLLRQRDYTAATLRDLAEFINHDETLADPGAFEDTVTAWIAQRGILAEKGGRSDVARVAREVWQAETKYLYRSRGTVALDAETVEAAAAALHYYVGAWNLPLNPENLDEMAYAMLGALGLRPAMP